MTQKILSLLREYKYEEAFWAAAENVMTDTDSQKLFLSIVMAKWQIVHLQDDIDKIKKLADEGNPYMQCAFARLHDFLHLSEESLCYCQKYYTSAMENGIADAGACLAWLYGSGAFGEKDLKTYRTMLENATNAHSVKAIQMRLKDIIYGNNGTEEAPRLACDMIRASIDTTAHTECDEPNIGCLYSLLGDGEFASGNRDEAIRCYEKAAGMYQGTAYYDLAQLTCLDSNLNIADGDRFEELMEKAQNAGDPRGYLQYMYVLDDDIFSALDEERKNQVTEIVNDTLTVALQLGESTAAYFFGYIYEEGKYGFKQDYAEAFSFYARGATMFDGSCFRQMANMILADKTAPEHYGEEFGYECAYRSMLFGCDTLDRVIEGYKNGYLTDHALAIEKIYLPEYEQKYPQTEDVTDDDVTDDIQIGNLGEDEEIRLCEELTEKAELFAQERDCPWKVTALIKKYVEMAERLKDNISLADTLYGTNSRMLDLISCHPRLNRQLLNIQLCTLRNIATHSETPADIRKQTAGEITETENEIEFLTKCITLAAKGQFKEIPQTGHLKKDPIEWTSRWEEVIDEADRKAYRRLAGLPRGMGWCFAFWQERSAALREFGIEWRSPSLMNPGVMFD